jgi:hypothetical protein
VCVCVCVCVCNTFCLCFSWSLIVAFPGQHTQLTGNSKLLHNKHSCIWWWRFHWLKVQFTTPVLPLCKCPTGRAITQAVIRRVLMAEARVFSNDVWGIYHKSHKWHSWSFLSQYFAVFPVNYRSTDAKDTYFSSTSEDWTVHVSDWEGSLPNFTFQ